MLRQWNNKTIWLEALLECEQKKKEKKRKKAPIIINDRHRERSPSVSLRPCRRGAEIGDKGKGDEARLASSIVYIDKVVERKGRKCQWNVKMSQ